MPSYTLFQNAKLQPLLLKTSVEAVQAVQKYPKSSLGEEQIKSTDYIPMPILNNHEAPCLTQSPIKPKPTLENQHL